MSPLTYWNLNYSSTILDLQWLLGFILVYCSQKVKWYTFLKMVSLIIINRNITHILDMSCCHKPQQQRCHHENNKICMFINYVYVDVLFSLAKAIAIMLERVIRNNQTLQTWIGHNATRYHNFNALPHALPYIFSQVTMGRP